VSRGFYHRKLVKKAQKSYAVYMKEEKFIVLKEDAGKRLDVLLFGRYPEQSRATWQKIIKQGGVDVVGRKVTPHYALREGDEVSVKKDTPNAPMTKKAKASKVPVIKRIFENDDYVIIMKPAGVVMHPAPGVHDAPLVTDWLLQEYPEIKKVGEDPTRPGLVHRLDRDTSGVVVIAKTQRAYKHLRGQFKEHTVEKIYDALVHGTVEAQEGEINFPVTRGSEGVMVARPLTKKILTPENQEGRAARTLFEVKERFYHATLVEARPVTGRTHQIRVHFRALNHPVVGDPLYGVKHDKNSYLPEPPRLMLHANTLCFIDLSGERVCYKAPAPAPFKKYLQQLKKI
jgi:23S rRNA pseudouridine1911/1915/1917 synthase